MSLLLDAANAWNDLHHIRYMIHLAQRGSITKIESFFTDEKFFHLSGMQYAADVDFGIRKAEYTGAKLIPALLNKRINDEKS